MLKLRRLGLMSLMAIGVLMSPDTNAAGDPAPDEMTGLKVGEKIPDFTLKDQNGKEHSLEGLLAKKGTTVLVFHRSANW
ncbi:MAG: hypothetical protein VCC01_06370 [Candidatus Hydrogenedentota bacterium]